MISTSPALNVGSRRYLVYSSVGDRSRFPEFWLDAPDRREFDLWISYYGDDDGDPWAPYVDRYFRRKGSKFQNLHALYVEDRESLEHYDAVFVVDDDIQIGTLGINRLFSILAAFDLWILQPAFAPHSRISHDVTARIPGAFLHWTNFIEICVPIFSRQALSRLMAVYDPRLIDWGIDYLYVWANGIHHRTRYAVVDDITCVNPEPVPGQPREIERLGSSRQLIANWENMAAEKGYFQWDHAVHGILYTDESIGFWDTDGWLGLHGYLARVRRVEIVESGPDRHLCRTSGDTATFTLNDSALAVLALCNGARTLCGLLLDLKASLFLDAQDMRVVQRDVQQVLAYLVSRGIVRTRTVPSGAATLVPAQPAGQESCLAPENVPRSIQIINLDYRTDRWLSFSSALDRAGTPACDRLAAVDAQAYESVVELARAFGLGLHRCYEDVPGFDGRSHRFKAKTACALSHRAALQRIVESRREGWHIILEDDNAPLHDWVRLLDSLADTLDSLPRRPDMIVLGDRVGTAKPATGIGDRFGAEAYAVHLSACVGLIESIDFSSGGFHLDYSLDNHYYHLCAAGLLDIAVLHNGPWIRNDPAWTSDIER